ncbi:MAG: protein kinase, partial [Clostridia bacterium]
KILNDQYNGDEEAEKRFINESKAVAMLSNKNIVGIYDVAIYPDIKYIVMEYLDGITLKEYFQKKGPLPWKEACSYMLQVLRALEHAHSKGVVHRDIKPQNLILLKSGEIKVTDFGIAKTPDMPSVTISDKAIGTVYYISPEQASGKATSFASDLYSVGIMLFEALTGTLPFVADNPITIAMMQINDVPQNPHEINHEIPVGLAQVILKAMKKKPEERFADAHSMLKAIDYVIKIPEVVFSEADQRNLFGEKSEYIDINMINTGEIEDYLPIPEKTADDESKKGKKSKKVHKKLRARIKENQNHSMFPIISGVFFAFLIVALSVGGYMLVKWLPLLFESDTSSDDFIVRELVGTEFNYELQTQLEKQNYYITTRDGYNPNYDFGVIILQDPASGPRHITGNVCRITLTINRFPNELTVPDVRYKSKSEAEKILKQFNLGVTFETKTDPYVNKDQVIGTYPAAGESVEAGRTITVYVCSGSGVTTAKIVPDLMNLDVKEAMKKLNDAYLSYEIVRE